MGKPLNTDPRAIWNQPEWEDNPFAAHNGAEASNPFKPWNEVFGSVKDLTDEDAATYGIERNTFGEEENEQRGFGDSDEDSEEEDEDPIF